MSVGLYALCSNADVGSIKIGRITGSIASLLSQYSTRYHAEGYQILRYWHGSEYYNIESEVHNHARLFPFRIRNSNTGRLTEWFRVEVNIIDDIVYEVINCNRRRINLPENRQQVSPQLENTPLRLENITHGSNKITFQLENIPLKLSVTMQPSVDCMYNDQYYWIVLKSEIEDGSSKYIESQLIRNFQKMYPPCTNHKAFCFSIKRDTGSPILYGLIRYNGLPFPYKMSSTSAIFSHIIRQEITQQKRNADKKVKRLTIYTRKKYQTNKQEIINKWGKINTSGQLVGSLLENFI